MADTMKLGWVAFTIPFMFVYLPQLLMEGTAVEIVMVATVKAIGVLALATATINYFATRLTPLQRVMAFAGALLLITPGWETNIAGLVLTFVAMGLNGLVGGESADPGPDTIHRLERIDPLV